MTTTADPDLKTRHRAMWALGDYGRIADELVPGIGPTVAGACRITAADRVLDIAAGTGNAALAAARTGARVTASDLTPELLAIGERRAAEAGLDLAWQVADAEALPFATASSDVALSAIGIMFAPFHRAAAGELLRVTRPGGRIGVASWTPQGFIGQMFAAMKPYASAPPPGAQPPPLWGEETHVRDLLGDRATELSAVRHDVEVDLFENGAQCRDYF